MAHSTLSGADLHEPKGVGSATSGQIYTADGLGSGSWSSASSALGITGQVAYFANPVAPTGWLECDGTPQSRTTFATLFTALTIQQTGTITNTLTTITGLSSTTNMKAGYFVNTATAGVTNGATIVSVDSPTQITISIAATASGSRTVIIYPFALGDGSTTFTLPDLKTSGRYTRSRTTAVQVGTVQADLTKSHTHTGTSGGVSAQHGHSFSGTTAGVSADHTHSGAVSVINIPQGTLGNALYGAATTSTGGMSADHVHGYSGTTGIESADHAHTTTTGNPNEGSGAEVRPLTVVLMACIKT